MTEKPKTEKPKPFPELVDLRAVTREADRFLTQVIIHNPHTMGQHIWIQAGLSDLSKGKRPFLRIRLDYGVTDFEHDSAIAVTLPLVGLKFKSAYNGTVFAEGWINPTEPFNVPPPGYNPAGAEGVHLCDHYPICKKDPHPMIDNFVPPEDRELWNKIRGWRVEIILSPHSEWKPEKAPEPKPNPYREVAEKLAEILGRSEVRLFKNTLDEVETLWVRLEELAEENPAPSAQASKSDVE